MKKTNKIGDLSSPIIEDSEEGTSQSSTGADNPRPASRSDRLPIDEHCANLLTEIWAGKIYSSRDTWILLKWGGKEGWG